MNQFKIYYDAQKSGDILAMELVENEFCGVFLLLGKCNYHELCLSQVERRYKDASYGELHEIRLNSSCRYRKDTAKNLYSMHVLDELMENVNYWTKCLPLGHDQSSWVNHSPNVMVARRCLNFVNNEYRRGLLDFEKAIETDTTPVQTIADSTTYIEPKCTLERSRLFELIVVLYNDEIEGREFNVKVAQNAIDKLTMKLKTNTDNSTVTPLENVINSINNLQSNNDDSTTNCHAGRDNVEVVIDSNEEYNSASNVIDERRVDIDGEINDDDVATDNDNVTNTRSDCHRLSLLDIIEKGKEKMKDMNIATQRKNMKVMTECHDNFLLEAFNDIIDETSHSNTFPLSTIKTRPQTVSSFIKDFHNLKRANDTNNGGYVNHFNQLIRR